MRSCLCLVGCCLQHLLHHWLNCSMAACLFRVVLLLVNIVCVCCLPLQVLGQVRELHDSLYKKRIFHPELSLDCLVVKLGGDPEVAMHLLPSPLLQQVADETSAAYVFPLLEGEQAVH